MPIVMLAAAAFLVATTGPVGADPPRTSSQGRSAGLCVWFGRGAIARQAEVAISSGDPSWDRQQSRGIIGLHGPIDSIPNRWHGIAVGDRDATKMVDPTKIDCSRLPSPDHSRPPPPPPLHGPPPPSV